MIKFVQHKTKFKHSPVNKLNELFRDALATKNITQIVMIIDCQFSANIDWVNKTVDRDLYCKYMKALIQNDYLAGLSMMQPYFNSMFRLNEVGIDLTDDMAILYAKATYVDLIEFAIKQKNWNCARYLLRYFDTKKSQQFQLTLDPKQDVISLIVANQLEELLPFISTNSAGQSMKLGKKS